MRKLFPPRAILLLVCLYTNQTKAGAGLLNDTAKIKHAIDGNINEWKIDSFETDKETQIQYAIDHDANFLFVAIKIADQRAQMKMMTQGMNMYLDRKGKHREGTGINFPLPQGMDALRSAFANRQAETPPDPKAMREALAKNMLLLKTFGLEDQEDRTQMVVEENGVNVSYDWDAANNMYIEYLVPMRFLGKTSDLNGKPLSVGWQLMSMQSGGGGGMQAPPSTSVARPGAGSGGGGRGRGSSNIPASDFTRSGNSGPERIFWTKHMLSF